MHKKVASIFALTLLLTAGAFAGTTKPQPKITLAAARATALKKVPGKIKSEELETEHGKLIYSFDIATSKSGVTEVNVDAINGKVIAVQKEDAAKEAAEKKQEAKEKSKQ